MDEGARRASLGGMHLQVMCTTTTATPRLCRLAVGGLLAGSEKRVGLLGTVLLLGRGGDCEWWYIRGAIGCLGDRSADLVPFLHAVFFHARTSPFPSC
jgi:hypothetical protein